MNLEDIRKIQEKIAKKKQQSEKTAKPLDEFIYKAKELDLKRNYKALDPEERKRIKAEEELLAILEYLQKTPKEEVKKEQYDLIIHDPNKKWDVCIGDDIQYFDPTLSYELTGYRPITKTEGLDFDPKLFTKAADNYRRNGRYTNLVPGTFKHLQYWKEEFDRCLNGLTIGKYRVTGENYFWLNYYRLLSVVSSGNGTELRNEDFPVFVNKQYEYFHYLEMVRVLKRDGIAFKSRAVGASEIAASNCAHAYTFHKGSINIITAYLSDYVSKTLSKVWLQLNFLNTLTESAFRHVRMKIDTDDHKKASKVDKDKNESGWMSEISGITHDKPRKLRGDRVYSIFFEEAGSDPVLEETYTQSEALVKVAGKRCGSRFAFGCFCAGTKVLDTKGYLRNIEDITTETGIVGYDGNCSTREKVTMITPEAYKECVNIHLEGNNHLKCSIDHPIMALVQGYDPRKRTTCTFINAQDLKEGDIVLGPKLFGDFGTIYEPDAFLLGHAFGCGWYGEDNVEIYTTTPEEQYYFISKYNCKECAKKTNISEFKVYTVNGVLPIFRKYEMMGLSKDKKKVPNNIWEWNKESVAEFISGYFNAEGNVQIKNNYLCIKLTCKYKEPLVSIMYLLRKFGISSYIHTEYKSRGKFTSKVYQKDFVIPTCEYYVLYVTGVENIKLFKENFHFIVNSKQNRLDLFKCAPKVVRKSKFKFQMSSNGKGSFFIGKELEGMQLYTVKKIEHIGVQRIYNLTADTTHTYIADTVLVSNTGGDQGAALAAMKKMFYNPNSYKILPYKNTYGSDNAVLFTGYFIPAYTMWFGDDKGTVGLDDRGVVNEDAAKAYYQKEFDTITDPHLLTITKAEFCFTPEDAFILEGSNRFDRELLLDQYQAITMHKTVEKPKAIKLHWGRNDSGETDRTTKPTVEFVQDGPMLITELPIKDSDGIPYSNLYVAGIDSIDADKSTSTGQTDVSQFCIVVMRRQFGLQAPKVVAIYKDRPNRIVDAFDNALKLCLFYNCKALIEATRVSIKLHFENYKALNYLMHRPKATSNTTIKTNLKLYGVPASEHIIEHLLDLIEQYISDYSEQIQFPDMLDELLRYSYENKRKFDIVAAFGICLLAEEDLHGKVARPVGKTTKSFNMGYVKNEYGQIELTTLNNEDSEYRETYRDFETIGPGPYRRSLLALIYKENRSQYY